MDQWSEENILTLIDIYKNKTLLWDPKHKDHFKKPLKEDAWREIGLEISRNADQCKKKVICLLASYRREKAKVKNSKGTGTGTDEVYASRWFAYEAFRFLEDRDEPRNRLNTQSDRTSGVEDSSEVEVVPSGRHAVASSSTPKAARGSKRKADDTNRSMMNSAFQILKTAASKLDKQPSQPTETDAFFTYVAAKVNKYSPETQKAMQHSVFELLMKADRGLFDWPAVNYQQPYNWQNPVESVPIAPIQPQPQHTVPSPAIQSPSEVSLLTNSSQQSWQQSPASSMASENIDDFV